jgi:uncharacterized protein YeaO (DUF488 family)
MKRVYEPPSPDDGLRVLVDRLWPRGLSKEAARVDEWPKEIAPSDELRKWYGHDPARWDEFRRRYRAQLEATGQIELVRVLRARAERQNVTLIFAASDEAHSNAAFLLELSHESA